MLQQWRKYTSNQLQNTYQPLIFNPATGTQTATTGSNTCSVVRNSAKSMKLTFYILLFFTLFSCKEHVRPAISESKNTNEATLTEQELFEKAYNIADFKVLKNSSRFIGRFRTTKRYNNTFFIEIDEIANGINLCVKQPVVYLPTYKDYDTVRSLPFNQLCYWYADESADSIKKAFLSYDTGKTIKDIECKGCLDPEVWTIEIYNKGQYSSTTKDYLRGQDSVFVNMILGKVKMYEKNNYQITYIR